MSARTAADEITRNSATFFPVGGCDAGTSSAGCCGETGGDGATPADGCSADAAQCTHALVYAGCFVDNSDRDLSAESYNIDPVDATLEVCNEFCYSRGYSYFAMQYGTECWCDNSFGHFNADGSAAAEGTVASPVDGCDSPCAGNPAQLCGGSWRNSVYEVEGR